jgi:excisionase family DNA binding protein
MNRNDKGVPSYATIKETARMLGLSKSRIYKYVEDGQLSSVRVANVILIPEDDIKNFQPRLANRPRKCLMPWRVSPDNNVLLATSLTVRLKAGKLETLMARLEEIRQGDQYLFPGTVARFITKTHPDQLEILLVWRSTAIPDEATKDCALAEFREVMADILDWDTAEYSEGQVLLHT